MYDMTRDYVLKLINKEIGRSCPEPVTDYEQGYADALNFLLKRLDELKDG